MTLPDAGHPEEYTEAEMKDLLGKFETNKDELTKNQKAAVARYNFKASRGQELKFREPGAAPPTAEEKPAAPAPAAAAGGADDVISLLPPEMQELAKKDPKELSKDERIALAKAKSQAVKAQMAAKQTAAGGEAGAKATGESAEAKAKQEARERARKFAVVRTLEARFGDVITGAGTQGEVAPIVVVKADQIPQVMHFLHGALGYKHLACLTAVDYPPHAIEVVYSLYAYDTRERLGVKCQVSRELPGNRLPSVPTVTDLWKGADWLEREVYDLFGIKFDGHPDMRRLLLPEGWTGHPLRKDYDLSKPQYIGMDANGDDIVSFREEDGW